MEKIRQIEKRLDVMESEGVPKALDRLTTIFDIECERNKERDAMNAKQNETLDNINENLIKLNHSINNTNEDIVRTNERVDSLECKVNESELKNTLDWRDFIIKALYVVVPAGVTYLIITLR